MSKVYMKPKLIQCSYLSPLPNIFMDEYSKLLKTQRSAALLNPSVHIRTLVLFYCPLSPLLSFPTLPTNISDNLWFCILFS